MPHAPRATPRERARAELMRDLLAAAREQLVRDGPQQLSLRAVARDLGLASSAVYRYVESRDALLTLLVAQSYDAVGQVVEEAARDAAAAGHGPARTWLEAARAFRRWALDDPHAFELIYGTPVPGYVAPRDTVAPAARLWGVAVDALVAARRDGTLHPAGPPVPDRDVVTPDVHRFARERTTDARLLEPGDAERCLTLFTSLVGALSAELFGHLTGIAADRERAFDVVVATAAAGVGLRIDLAEAWGGASPER